MKADPKPEAPWRCVYLRAKKALPALPSHKLAAVAAHLGVGTDDGHTALADAWRAWRIDARLAAAQPKGLF